MAISFIGHAAAAATSVATTNAVGDLLLVCAFRSASATPPTLPGTYTNVMTAPANGGGGTNNSAQLGWRIATATNEGSGTWTNATAVEVLVLRGTHPTAPIGGSAEDSGNATQATIIYPAVTLTDASGGSWLVGFGMRTTTGAVAGVATAPTGMTNQGSVPATPYMAAHTAGPTGTNWSQQTVTPGGTTVKAIGVVFEVLAPPVFPKAGTDGAKAADSATRKLDFASPTVRQAIIDGFISAQSETHGWNAERPNIPVSAVVRTSSTVVTITLPALAAYDITAQESVTGVIPTIALVTGSSSINADPTIDIATAVAGISKSGTDGAKAADTGTAVETRVGIGTDGAKATDAGTNVGAFPKAGTDGTKAADTGTGAESRIGSGTDGAKAADSGVSSLLYAKTGTDGAKATDASTRLLVFAKSGTDGAKATDAATSAITYSKVGTDGAKATDAGTNVATRPKAGTDGAKVTDTGSAVEARAGVGTDGAKAADSGSTTLAGNFPKAGTDGAKAADSATGGRSFAKAGTDGAKATDAATRFLVFIKSATDGAKATDAATRVRSIQLVGIDGAKAADTGSRLTAALILLTDRGVTIDDASYSYTPSFIPVGSIRVTNVALRIPDMANADIGIGEEALI